MEMMGWKKEKLYDFSKRKFITKKNRKKRRKIKKEVAKIWNSWKKSGIVATIYIVVIVAITMFFNSIIIKDQLKIVQSCSLFSIAIIIIALVVKEYEIKEKVQRNALTGLYEKERLDVDLVTRCRDRKSFVLLFIDLNEFKEINDSYGHGVGDHILVELSKKFLQLEEISHFDMICYRVGGDEFAIIIDEKIEFYLNEISELNKKFSAKKKDLGMSNCTYNFAYGAVKSDDVYQEFGYSCNPEEVAKRIKKEADDLMYHYKEIYHKKKKS